MKSAWQIGVLLIVLMGIVLGATFLTQYTNRTKEEKPKETTATVADTNLRARLLDFPVELAVWRKDIAVPLTREEEQAKYSRNVEMGRTYRYDFWFRNPQVQPVPIGLTYKSCTCSDVQCYLFPPAAWSEWQRHTALAGWLALATQADVLAPSALAVLLAPMQRESSWQAMGEVTGTDKNFVPAVTIGADQTAVLRVNFKPRRLSIDPGGERLGISLRAQISSTQFDTVKLDINYETVPPIGVMPPILDVGELGQGEKRVQEIFYWSTTRESLAPKVEVGGSESKGAVDECVEIGKPTPLTSTEVEQMVAAFGPKVVRMKPLCAYRLPITVYESRGRRQLDLGPFGRRLTLTEDELTDPIRIPITGMVRGEVRVVGGDDRDRIDLGGFKLDREASKYVTLTTVDPQIELAVERVTDKAVEARLERLTTEGRKEWRLIVRVAPNSFAGELPPGTVVVLTTRGPGSRRIRIPVTGTALR